MSTHFSMFTASENRWTDFAQLFHVPKVPLPTCLHANIIPYRRYQRYAELQKVCLTVPQSCVRCCHTRLEIGYQPHSTTSTLLHSQLLGHGRTWCVFLCSLAQVNSLTTWWASKDVKPGMVVDIWWQSNEISVEGWKPLSGWCTDIIRYYTYDLYRFVSIGMIIPEMRTSPCHHLHSHPGYFGVNVHSTPFESPTVSLRIGPHGAPRAAEQQRKSFSSGTSGWYVM